MRICVRALMSTPLSAVHSTSWQVVAYFPAPLSSSTLHNVNIDDLDILQGFVIVVRLDIFNQGTDIHTLCDASKDGMLAVQPRTGNGRNKELRAIRIRAGIRHG